MATTLTSHYRGRTDTYNYKARYYAPGIGRFFQPDPLGYAAGDMNLYSYVRNDSTNMIDPLGMLPCGNNSGKKVLESADKFMKGLTNKGKRVDFYGPLGANVGNLWELTGWSLENLQRFCSSLTGGLIPPPTPYAGPLSCNEQASLLRAHLDSAFNSTYDPSMAHWSFETKMAPGMLHSWVEAMNSQTGQHLVLDPWSGANMDVTARDASTAQYQIDRLEGKPFTPLKGDTIMITSTI